MAKIVTMGEIMLRLSTPGNEKFIQADEFDINYGGSEANVAVSLANYGYDTEFVSAIPDNPIGDCAVAALRKYGDVYKRQLCVRPTSCTTVPDLPLPVRRLSCLILMRSLRMRTGFILPASRRHCQTARPG